MTVFAVVATRIALSSLFAIQGSALFVKKYNWLMFHANVVYALVFLGIAYPATALLPDAYKLYGYLLADLIAHIPTYWYKHWGMCRYIGRPSYGVAALWTGATLCVLFAPLTHGLLYLAALALIATPTSLRAIRNLYQQLRSPYASS
jgi:hypothetical protein